MIGKFFSKNILGFYQRGQQIPQMTMTSIDGSLAEVLYPTLSIVQNDLERLKAILRRSMKLSMYLCSPIMFGLLAISKPLTIVLLTEKWLPSVPFMQLSCIICLLWPLSARLHALNAMGLSSTTFKISIISKIITLLFIVIGINISIYAIMFGTLFASIISTLIITYYVKKYINYTYLEFFKDLFPIFIVSILMMALVFLIGLIHINIYIRLFIQIVFEDSFYIVGSFIFKLDSINFVVSYLKNIRK